MNWTKLHVKSQALAIQAELAVRSGDADSSKDLYLRAARFEKKALKTIDSSKIRTYEIIAISVVSLFSKAEQPEIARGLIDFFLSKKTLSAAADEALLTMRGFL